MKQVGYLTNYPDGLVGERGLYYDYLLASNGIWIEAEGKLLAARVPVAECEIRGLAPLEVQVVLRYGKIPSYFFNLALNEMLKTPEKESYVAVTFNDGYHITVPEQKPSGARVEYLNLDSVALEMHSHGTMGSWFSLKDNEDEQGFRLYGVVGRLDRTPVVHLRVGVYGYRYPIAWGDVFDGSLTGALEEEKEEEVESELHDFIPKDGGVDSHRWLRWDWWLRRGWHLPTLR